MRFWVGFAITLLVSVLAVGCASKDQQAGYAAVFEDAPNLYDDGVYDSGHRVGNIFAKETGATGETRLMITLSPEFLNETGNNFVLYAHAGRLEVDKLHAFGEPLSQDALICGFTSKSKLTWFKLKTLLNDRVRAAQKRAKVLQARIG